MKRAMYSEVRMVTLMLALGAVTGAAGAVETEPVASRSDELEAIYVSRCASCHDKPVGRTPPRGLLKFIPPHIITRSLMYGSMKIAAAGLAEDEIGSLANYLSSLPNRPLQTLRGGPVRVSSNYRISSRRTF